MIKQLRRAHYLFLLHHDVTLETLYQRIGRAPFCARLDRFWRKFAWNWDVLLNGNPAVEVYDGIKLSAGGELGIGVGEEEWGSGEREVLEDFVSRTDGLVDLVVSRFGEPSMDAGLSPWLGSGVYPRPSDGIIFSGVGAISRESLVRVSHWIEWIYTYGDSAYGASEDPTAPRRRKQKRRQRGRLPVRGSPGSSQPDQSLPPGIPRPLVVGTPQRAQSAERKDSPQPSDNNSPARSEQSNDRSGLRPDVFMKYLTLGYGSWLTGTPSSHPRVSALKDDAESSDTREDSGESTVEQSKPNVQQIGKFVVGLRDDNDREASAQSPEGIPEGSPTRQVDRRILHVRLTSTTETKELQAIVYAVSTSLPPTPNHKRETPISNQAEPTIHLHLPLRPPNTVARGPESLSEHQPPTPPTPETTIQIHLTHDSCSTHRHGRNHHHYHRATRLRPHLRPHKPHHPLLNPQHPGPSRSHSNTRHNKHATTLATYRVHQYPPPADGHVHRHTRTAARNRTHLENQSRVVDCLGAYGFYRCRYRFSCRIKRQQRQRRSPIHHVCVCAIFFSPGSLSRP